MNNAYEKLLGQNIRSLRIKAGLTQDALAARLQVNGCDITRSALAKIEAGQRHIYADELKQLKTILRVSFDDLFI